MSVAAAGRSRAAALQLLDSVSRRELAIREQCARSGEVRLSRLLDRLWAEVVQLYDAEIVQQVASQAPETAVCADIESGIARVEAGGDMLFDVLQAVVSSAIAQAPLQMIVNVLTTAASQHGIVLTQHARSFRFRDERSPLAPVEGAYPEGYAAIGIDWETLNRHAATFAREHAGGLIRGISADEIDRVRQILYYGHRDGWHPYQMAREIRQTVGLTSAMYGWALRYRERLLKADIAPARAEGLSQRYVERLRRHRSETIARTETIRAAGHGQYAAWSEVAKAVQFPRMLLRRVWIALPDQRGPNRTCDYCLAMNGKVVAFDGFFEIRDPDRAIDQPIAVVRYPPAHPRCRCATATRVVSAQSRQAQRAAPLRDEAQPGDFETIVEAEQWMNRHYPEMVVDFGRAHIDTINPALAAFHAIAQRYPEAARSVKYLGTMSRIKPTDAMGRPATQPRTAFASVVLYGADDAQCLLLNPRFFRHPDLVRKEFERAVDAQWLARTSLDPIQAIIMHEFGHVVHHYYTSLVPDSVGFLPYVWGGWFGRIRETAKRFLSIATRLVSSGDAPLSQYGLQTEAEAFAEAFAVLHGKGPLSRHPAVIALQNLLTYITDPSLRFSKLQRVEDIADASEAAKVRSRLYSIARQIGVDTVLPQW